MKTLILSITLIALVGCTSFNSPHGYSIKGQYDNKLDGTATPTIVPDGFSPMGSRIIHPDGTVEERMFGTIIMPDGSSGTGKPAEIMAETGRLQQKILICAIARDSAACLN